MDKCGASRFTFSLMATRFDQFHKSHAACLQGLSIDSHNITPAVCNKTRKFSQLTETKTSEANNKSIESIFGLDTNFNVSSLLVSRPVSRTDENNSNSASSSSYQYPVVFKPPPLKPTYSQKTMAAMELLNKYNDLRDTTKTNPKVLTRGQSSSALKSNDRVKVIEGPTLSTPNLQLVVNLNISRMKRLSRADSVSDDEELRKSSLHSSGPLRKEDILPNSSVLVQSQVSDPTLPIPTEGSLIFQSVTSMHDIKGLPPAKTTMPMYIHTLSIETDDNPHNPPANSNASPAKEILHNYLGGHSPTNNKEGNTLQPVRSHQLPGRGLKKYSSTRPVAPRHELKVPSQLQTLSPKHSSRPNSPLGEPRRGASPPTNIFIPPTKKVDFDEEVEPDDADFRHFVNMTDESPTVTSPHAATAVEVAVDNGVEGGDMGKGTSSYRTPKAAKPKRIAYVLSSSIDQPTTSSLQKQSPNASMSLELSNAIANDLDSKGTSTSADSSSLATRPLPLEIAPPREVAVEAMTDNISMATDVQLSLNSVDISNLDAEHRPGAEHLPYQVHKKIMGWKLTSPRRRRDLVGMLDIVHKTTPVDLLMGDARMTNETRERRSSSHDKSPGQQQHHSVNRKIPSIKKLEEELNYIQDFQQHSSWYASAAPGSPLYYIEDVKEGENGGGSRKLISFDRMGNGSSSPSAIRRQTRAWDKSVNRVLKIRQAYKSVQAIKRMMDEKKKRQTKLEELTAVGLVGNGSRFGHSAFMDSMEQMASSYATDYYDDSDNESRNGKRGNSRVPSREGTGRPTVPATDRTLTARSGSNINLSPLRPRSRTPGTANARILQQIGSNLSPEFRGPPVSPPFKINTKNLSPIAKAKIMKQYAYDYPVNISMTRNRMVFLQSKIHSITLMITSFIGYHRCGKD